MLLRAASPFRRCPGVACPQAPIEPPYNRLKISRRGWKPAMPRHIRRTASLRRRLYEILEHGAIGDRTGLVVGRLIIALIVINLVSMTLDSVPALQTQYGALFTAIELLSLSNTHCASGWRPSMRQRGTRVSARRDGSSSRARSA